MFVAGIHAVVKDQQPGIMKIDPGYKHAGMTIFVSSVANAYLSFFRNTVGETPLQ